MPHINNTGYMYQHIASLLAKQSDQVLQEQLGIGYSQFKLLQELQNRPTMRQLDIAQYLGQTEASISRQVKIMIKQGLIEVTLNRRNRREHITKVTLKGVKLTEAAQEVLAKYHQTTLNILSDKQHDQLTEVLEALHNTVCTREHTYLEYAPYL